MVARCAFANSTSSVIETSGQPFVMPKKTIVLSYATLADFLRAKLHDAEVTPPADLVIVGVEIDGQRVFFQCVSASWPAVRGFGRIPVFYRSST
jgi:hypothetical protein